MVRATVLSTALVLLTITAASPQQAGKSLKEQLVGTWTFVSSTVERPDGGNTWGPNAKGLLILTPDGYFSTQIMRADLPKYASNSRLKATPEEQTATVEGVVSYFGKYTIDEGAKTLTYHLQGASFPNWIGNDQKRPIISITGEELKYQNPSPSGGGKAGELTWRRAK